MVIHLIWAQYVVKNVRQYSLFAILGSQGGKYYALKSSKMAPDEVELIRKNMEMLTTLSLDDKIVWVKNQCPLSYKNGFRTLFESNTTVLATYPIGELSDMIDEAKKKQEKAKAKSQG